MSCACSLPRPLGSSPTGHVQGQTRPALSVVMPAYNEAQRLPRTLQQLAAAAAHWPGGLELIIVDDGSTDSTVQCARTWAPTVQLLRQPRRLGAGAALRRGALAATGHRILLCDADGAVPFCALPRLWRLLDAGYDIVASSRLAFQRQHSTGARLHRRLAGTLWRRWLGHTSSLPVSDPQCGFKLLRRSAVGRLFPRLRSNSFALYPELFLEAERLNLRTTEVAVPWSAVAGSKVQLWRDVPWMAAEWLRACRREKPNLAELPP